MTTIKSYTDLSQSKILADILPHESADMGLYYSHNPQAARNQMWVGTKAENADIPCWSLAALVNIFKTQIKNSTDISIEFLTTSEETSFVCCSFLLLDEEIISDSKSIEEEASTDVDACVKIILKLHKQKLL